VRTLPSLCSGRSRPEPRAVRVLPGGRLPALDPSRWLRTGCPPQRSALEGRQAAGAAVPPLGWRPVPQARGEALGRSVRCSWPEMPCFPPRWAAPVVCIPAWTAENAACLGAAEVKHLVNQLKLSAEGNETSKLFQKVSDCYQKLSVRRVWNR